MLNPLVRFGPRGRSSEARPNNWPKIRFFLRLQFDSNRRRTFMSHKQHHSESNTIAWRGHGVLRLSEECHLRKRREKTVRSLVFNLLSTYFLLSFPLNNFSSLSFWKFCRQYQAHVRGLNAYDRHKKFIHDYGAIMTVLMSN